MNAMSGIGTVASPTRSQTDLPIYEDECRAAMQPWLKRLLDIAEAAGWRRRTVASTLMFLAARELVAGSEDSH